MEKSKPEIKRVGFKYNGVSRECGNMKKNDGKNDAKNRIAFCASLKAGKGNL
jgi:hypothetical protein